MKKIISALMTIMLIASADMAAFAENETHYNRSVTLTVRDTIVNTTDEKLFGYANEFSYGKVYSNLLLDKNYGAHYEFSNDFENEEYTRTAPEYKTAYYNTRDTFTYIANGDTYGGNLSSSRYMVKDDAQLYDGIYNAEGALNSPPYADGDSIESYTDNFRYKYAIHDSLVPGGVEGFVGFSSLYEIAKGDYKRNDIQDLTVVTDPDNSRNHVAKLAPAGGNQWYGRDSFFGKNYVAIIDRNTKFTYRMRIDSAESDCRLGITKQLDMENIRNSAMNNKFVHTGTLNTAKIATEHGKHSWFDALKFKNGTVYLAGNDVGEYQSGKWYTVEYTLDIKYGDHYNNGVRITDDKGNVVIDTSSDIELDAAKNMGKDCYFINNNLKYDFEFDERNYYGMLLSAHTDYANSKENTVVYIDDMNFETVDYYDDKDAVVNQKLLGLGENNLFSFGRIGGVTANNYSWKESLGAPQQRKAVFRTKGTNDGRPAPQYFGVLEYLKLVDCLDPDAEISYTINLHDSDEDIIDLIEFLTADGDIDGDGEDWAEIRRENGIADPARIYLWELGNEPDINFEDPGTWEKLWDIDSYLKRTGEIIEILKEYSPSHIKIGVGMNEYIQNVNDRTEENNWDRRFLNMDLGPDEEFWPYAKDIDYFICHGYDRISLGPTMLVISKIKNKIASSNYPHIKIAYTEHNTGMSLQSMDDHYKGAGLASAIHISAFFNRMMREDIVACANLYSYSAMPGPWATFYEHEGEFKPTATLKLMDMYARNAIGDVLDTTLTGFIPTPSYAGWDGWNHNTGTWKSGSYGYTPAAVMQEDGTLNIFISNARNHTLTLNVLLDEAFNDYNIVEKQVITGKNQDDTIFSYDGYTRVYNQETGLYDKIVYQNDMVYDSEYDQSLDNVTIVPYSVTMLKLKRNKVDAQIKYIDGVQYLDISGIVNEAKKSKDLVTVFITDKDKQKILYAAETVVDSDNNYRFLFEFGENPADCTVLINYCGTVREISDEFKHTK